MQLTEQYRPNQWSEVVGQDKALGMLTRRAKRSLAGRAYWIAGPSGTGKSTIARLIALEVADPFNIDEVDATDLSAAAVRDLERISHLRGLGEKSGRAFIVNEAHGLNKAAVRQLLTTLEADRVPSHVVWVFTTTDQGAALFDGIDKSPLLSRCMEVPLAKFGMTHSFALHAKQVAEREGLDGQPLEDYLALVKKHKNNLRAVLQEIESGVMSTDLDETEVSEVADCVSQLLGR